MGLSTEERLTKFFSGLRGMRRALLCLQSTLGRRDDEREREGPGIVEDWIRQLDCLAGKLIDKLNSSPAFWLLGSNQMSVISLYAEHYNLGRQEHHVFDLHQWPHGSLARFYFDPDERSLTRLSDFWSRESHGFQDDDQLRVLGAFWDAFSWIDALLYPMNRYKDGVFAGLHEDFLRLTGEMLNRRFALRSWYKEADGLDTPHQAELEQILLCRQKLVNIELGRIWKDVAKDLSSDVDRTKIKEPFDHKVLLTKIGKMALADVKEALEQAEQAEWQREREGQKNVPPLTGMRDNIRPEEDLVKIVETSDDQAEVQRAVRDLGTHYSTFMGEGWKDRFKSKSKSKKKPTKNARKAKARK